MPPEIEVSEHMRKFALAALELFKHENVFEITAPSYDDLEPLIQAFTELGCVAKAIGSGTHVAVSCASSDAKG